MSTTIKKTAARARRQHAPRSTSRAGRHPARTYRRGIGYVRVSRVNGREGDSYISKDVQREKIEALAKLHDVEIVDWYVDEDRSGKDWERPGFLAMIDDVESGRASVCLVATLSRFARSVVVAERALQIIEGDDPRKPTGQLIAGDVNVDTRTSTGRMMRGFLTLISQWEVDTKTEGWLDARERAQARGVWTRPVPVGYRRDAKRRLVPDSKTRRLVAGVFKRRAEGASWTELLDYWRGRGGPKISANGLRRITLQPIYVGGTIDGCKVEPLVSRELFDDVQARPGLRSGTGEGSLLAGIVHCSSCGGPMTTGRAARLSDGSPGKRTYVCPINRLIDGERCPSRMSVDMERTDEIVEARFLDWARVEIEGNADALGEIDDALSALVDAEAELDAFQEGTSASRHPERFRKGVAKREEAIDQAQALVDELRASSRVETIRATVAGEWPDLSLDERRTLVASAIERVDVHPRSAPRRLASPEAQLAAVRDRLDVVSRAA